MKKLLSILATISLVATTTITVVACGSAKTEYDNIMTIINNTKGEFGTKGEVIQQSGTTLLYIGAKDNASSRSFEYALDQEFAGGQKNQGLEATKKELNEDFNDDDLTGTEPRSYWNALWNGMYGNDAIAIDSQNSVNTDTDSDRYGMKIGEENGAIYGVQENRPIENIKKYVKHNINFESIITNSVSDIWENRNFTKLIDNYVTNDFLVQVSSIDSTGVDKTDVNNIVSKAKKLKESLVGLKGPQFLLISNGHIVGGASGWNRYKDFDGETKNDQAKKDVESFLASLSKGFENVLTPSSFNEDKLTLIDGADTWSKTDDKGTSNWDYDEDKSTSSGADGNESTESLNSYSYNISDKYA